MKSGLYVLAGESATALHAAWANWLFTPTTKDSKVFRGLSPGVPEDPAGCGAACPVLAVEGASPLSTSRGRAPGALPTAGDVSGRVSGPCTKRMVRLAPKVRATIDSKSCK